MHTERSTQGKSTRRRGAALLADIHKAVRDELDAHGYAGVTFDGVARRARVSKPVLYRRFPNRANMVADALVAELQGAEVTSSTGALRSDLQVVFASFMRPSRAVGPAILRALLGDADEQLMAQVAGLARNPAMASLDAVITAARGRGELGPKPIPESVNNAIASIFQAEALRHAIEEADIERIIDDIAMPLYRLHSGR